MKEPQTTINYKGIDYPFYKTNRGQFDFENAGFSNEGIKSGRIADLLALVYFTTRDCARRAGKPLQDSFEEFIDNTSPDVIQVFVRLNEARLDQEGDSSVKNQEPGTKTPETTKK